MRNPLLAPLLCLLTAGSAAAFEPMTLSQCRAQWREFVEATPGFETFGNTYAQVSHRVTEDGWCRLSGADPALSEANFATMDWQTELGPEGALPLALQVRLEDLRPDATRPPTRTDFVSNPPLDVVVTLRRVPEARQVIVEQIRVTSPAGDDLRATAVFDRVDLSSVGMAQMSMGSVALRQVNGKVRLNGWVESQIMPELGVELRGRPEAIRNAARAFITDLPREVFDVETIQNMYDFVYDLPAPRGDLEVSFASPAGVGLLQLVIVGLSSFSLDGKGTASEDEAGQAAALLLDGSRIEVVWTPDPDQTD